MSITATAAKGSAAGQYLGYALQPVRLCFHLLTSSDGSSVSIEHLDDIAVHEAGGSTLLEQTKSAIKQNPVSDWASDLWKAFSTWLDNIDSGAIDPEKTRFRLYVAPIRTGYWVQRLSNTNTNDDVDQAISDLIQAVNGLPKRPACFKYLKRVFDAEPAKRRLLIKNFHFESDSDDPVDAIRALLKITIMDAMVDVCCEYGIGSAKETADRLIRLGLPTLIEANKYRATFKAFVHKNDLSRLLVSLAATPPSHVIEQTLSNAPPFVQQLDIVDMPLDAKLRAVSDFMQCSADKTLWAERGLIVEESLLECDKDLVRQHHLIRGEIEDVQAGLDPKARGRVLYNRCGLLHAQLEGREVPGHFVPGCYNSLADRFEVGWHPQYSVILGANTNPHNE
jgi:hypothetical protein